MPESTAVNSTGKWTVLIRTSGVKK
jgi:hypothetical protein